MNWQPKIARYALLLLPKDSGFMSEDAIFKNDIEKFGLVGAEKVQAEIVHAIIVLGTSIGPVSRQEH